MEQPDDLDLITRTVLSEAHNQGPLGQAAVAAVIKNRMAKNRMSGGDVVLERNQFEPWNKPGNPNDPMKWSAEDPRYQSVQRIVQGVMSGQMQDPTKGATHFANVSTVRQRNGGTVGNHGWINPANQTAQIGAHTFFAPEGRVQDNNFNREMTTSFWANPTGAAPTGSPSTGAPGMTGAPSSTPGADMPSPSAMPIGQGASGAQGGQPDFQSMMRQVFGGQPKQQQNAPILGRMLFGDGGLPGMFNKIPTPGGGNGLIGGLFNGFGGAGGAGAAAGGAPMALPGVGQAMMGASSAAPSLIAPAAAGAGAGAAGGLGSALASLFALI